MKKQLFLFALLAPSLLLGADNETERLKQAVVELVNKYQPEAGDKRTTNNMGNIREGWFCEATYYETILSHPNSDDPLELNVSTYYPSTRAKQLNKPLFCAGLYRRKTSKEVFFSKQDAIKALSLLRDLHSKQ